MPLLALEGSLLVFEDDAKDVIFKASVTAPSGRPPITLRYWQSRIDCGRVPGRSVIYEEGAVPSPPGSTGFRKGDWHDVCRSLNGAATALGVAIVVATYV